MVISIKVIRVLKNFYLAACSQTVNTNGLTLQMNTVPGRTESSISIPLVTTVATKTSTQTPTPTITSTPDPPPDLDLKDVAIYPPTFDQVAQRHYLIGMVKNNTDQIMTFSAYDVVFTITFNVWEYNLDIYANQYDHFHYEEDIKLYKGYGSRMNCILYPREEGYFNYSTIGSGMVEYLLEESVKEYTGPLGIWFTYQGYYGIDPKLPLYYHPGTESLQFTKENGVLTFDYDIVNIPDLLDNSHTSKVYSWLVLLDKDGKIINILQKWMADYPAFRYAYGGNFHIHSSTAVRPGEEEYFVRFMEVTPEMIEQTDHMEVLNEFQEGDTCQKENH